MAKKKRNDAVLRGQCFTESLELFFSSSLNANITEQVILAHGPPKPAHCDHFYHNQWAWVVSHSFQKCSSTQLHILWTAASFTWCLQSSKQGLSRSVKDTYYLNTHSFFTFSSSGRRISTYNLWWVSGIQWAGLSAQTPASSPLWRWRFLSGLRGSWSVQAASFLPLANDTTSCETSGFKTSPSREAGRRNPELFHLPQWCPDTINSSWIGGGETSASFHHRGPAITGP